MANGATGSKTYRLVTAAFGLLFMVVAVAIVVVSDRTFGPILASAGIGILGVDAMVSAFRNKPSLLSRIGPLP
jgi:hypothetical protein